MSERRDEDGAIGDRAASAVIRDDDARDASGGSEESRELIAATPAPDSTGINAVIRDDDARDATASSDRPGQGPDAIAARDESSAVTRDDDAGDAIASRDDSSAVTRDATAASEPPPAVPSAWSAYALTSLMLPIAFILIELSMFLIATAIALYEVATGNPSSLASITQRTIEDLFLDKKHPLATLLAGVFGNSLAFAGTALLVTRARPIPRLRLHRARAIDFALAIAGLLGLTVALDGLLVLLELHDTGNLAEMRATFAHLTLSERLLASLIIALGAGFGEELFFRGYLHTRLELAHSRFAAIAITSIIFGVFHLDPIHTPVSAIMGLYLALCLLATGSLWIPIAAHVANNFCAILLSDLPTSTTIAAVTVPAGFAICGLALSRIQRRHRGEHHAPVW